MTTTGINDHIPRDIANSKTHSSVALVTARPWEKCKEHGPASAGVWACPTCLVELRKEIERLRELGAETQEEMEGYREECARLRLVLAAERERCHEIVADEQVYPTNPNCAALNPVLHRIMRLIEAGTTLDDLRREAQSGPNPGVHP